MPIVLDVSLVLGLFAQRFSGQQRPRIAERGDRCPMSAFPSDRLKMDWQKPSVSAVSVVLYPTDRPLQPD